MKIGHAVMNEHGNAKGGVPGDSTGKEIRIAEWYDRPWSCYLEPKDDDVADRAVSWMERICEDGRFGYDQEKRWGGYTEIKKHGFDGAGKGDFDCSSLVISCYIFAGLDLLPTGYTGNMERLLMATGAFNRFDDAEHLKRTDKLKAGGVLIAKGHTCMVLETGAGYEDKPEEGDGIYIGTVTAKGSVRVRNAPTKKGATLKIIHKGDALGILTEDAETGWLYTKYGWITNNRQYVEVHFYD